MWDFNEYHDLHVGAARLVSQRVAQLAREMGMTLTTHWHRGREFADMDSYYLTLDCGVTSLCRHVPDAWLEALWEQGRDERIDAALREMIAQLREFQARRDDRAAA